MIWDTFQIGSRIFKKMLQKMIKIIIKASNVSKINMNKSLSIMKKFMKMLKIVLREEHLRNDFFVEYFLLFEARFKCG